MNIQEAQIIALQIRAKAIEVQVIGMQCYDFSARQRGIGTYLEDSYLELSNELHAIHNEIQELARSGVFQ